MLLFFWVEFYAYIFTHENKTGLRVVKKFHFYGSLVQVMSVHALKFTKLMQITFHFMTTVAVCWSHRQIKQGANNLREPLYVV